MIRAREWWLDHWVDLAMATYYVGIVLVGLVGFRDPSTSISAAVGYGYVIYALGMIGLGTAAIRSILVGSRRSEAACLLCIGVLTALHGLMLILAGSGGLQTGIRLLCAFVGAFPFAYLRAETVYTRRDLRKYLRAAELTRLAERTWETDRATAAHDQNGPADG